jgi:hypothetical protein
MSNGGLNLKSVILGGIISLLVTIAGGYILFTIQNQKPILVYSSSGTIPFEGEDEIIGIYLIEIGNSGKKVAKLVDCYIELKSAIIKESKIDIDPAIEYNITMNPSKIILDIPMLNPSEYVEIYILATTNSTLPKKPIISMRGEGIIGKIKSEEQQNIYPNLTWILALTPWFLISVVIISEIIKNLRKND